MTILEGLEFSSDNEDIDDYEFLDDDEDEGINLFDEVSPDEILEVLRKLKMGFKN